MAVAKNNNNILGQNSQFFTATQAGYYKLRGTAPSGCTALSNSIQVIVNCREGEERSPLVNIYPNPAIDNLTVTLIDESSVRSLQIRNIQGQIVSKFFASSLVSQLNIEDLSAGVYFVEVENSNGLIFFSKFVKE